MMRAVVLGAACAATGVVGTTTKVVTTKTFSALKCVAADAEMEVQSTAAGACTSNVAGTTWTRMECQADGASIKAHVYANEADCKAKTNETGNSNFAQYDTCVDQTGGTKSTKIYCAEPITTGIRYGMHKKADCSGESTGVTKMHSCMKMTPTVFAKYECGKNGGYDVIQFASAADCKAGKPEVKRGAVPKLCQGMVTTGWKWTGCPARKASSASRTAVASGVAITAAVVSLLFA